MVSADFDILIIGGGHAGVEAALAASRMGKRAGIITMDPSKLALMSCNPAIGGIGKSQLVKEIDALGGLMGAAIDATGIQFRRLNLSRGAAVWSTRAQADRVAYNDFVVRTVAEDPRVTVIEGIAGRLLTDHGQVCGLMSEAGEKISAKAIIIASGTFLGGLIHIGETKIKAGRHGDPAAWELSKSLDDHGFELGRLKTGTPPRLDGATIDWSKCEIQPGEEPIPFFSWQSNREPFTQTPCYLTKTTKRTKELILKHLQASPMFSGQIDSTGPRYCPSIEDKFYRFRDKPSHQIFLEPEGNGTSEIYPNGFSTALPEEIQREAIRTIEGLEQTEIIRPGYAVEYDYCPAHQIDRSLQTRRLRGLFFAGQINGTSGYEEAAAQGLMAGVNASLWLDGEPPFILGRSEAYIGVMLDDLVTRSTTEPYRMFTSRAEYRLWLREDNARDRLFGHASRLGLVPPKASEQFDQLRIETGQAANYFRKTNLSVNQLGKLAGRFQRRDQISLADLLKQPLVRLEDIALQLADLGAEAFSQEALNRASIQIRYQGYIDKQKREIEKARILEKELIPDSFSYDAVPGLRNEAREKWLRFHPASLGQAGRIEGVTPGDVAVLSVFLKRHKMAESDAR